jgi:ABC-type polysaccharide/polyol phosphate export permease
LPFLGVLTLFIGFFVGLLSTVVAAKLPDVIHVIGPGLNLVLWLTPVFYPASLIPTAWQPVLWLNPVASLIAAYRWALFWEVLPSYLALFVWLGLIPLFILSLYLFKRVELKLVDWL